ncbi:hypothetical protein [Cardiobacterium valvarum]|nr:hypothetical protein [Cardiobacterium valvarum]
MHSYYRIFLILVSGLVMVVIFSWNFCLSYGENMQRIFWETSSQTKERLDAIKASQEEDRIRSLEECRPEKSISKDELFSLAMQDYWQKKMKRLWPG